MLNENQRLDYLDQLGVVSWMPRQPLPGAHPSDYFAHQPPDKTPSPLKRLRPEPADAVPSASVAPTVPEAKPQPAVVPDVGHAKVPPPITAETAAGTVNRVPQHLQLMFIRQQGNRPLIVSHFGERGDTGDALLPLCQSMLRVLGYTEPLVSLPFIWPMAGMSPVCREEEFIQMFRALLGGERLGCRSGQACWWFGPVPELLAGQKELLDIDLQYPTSLTEVALQANEKRSVLYRLLELKKEVASS